MNKYDILCMAREVGGDLYEVPFVEIERFAHLVYESVFRDANIAASRTILDAAVLEEREACAKLAETYEAASSMKDAPHIALIFKDCADAIRARSNP